MNLESNKLLESALTLPPSDRATIAARFILSLDTDVDSDADAEWAVEIQRRINSIDDGSATLIPWDEVLMEVRDRENRYW